MQRVLLRSAVPCGLLALLFVLMPLSAEATIEWCSMDPVIKIDGSVAAIELSSDRQLHASATGPAQIVITIPATSTGELLATDRGWGGYGYEISFVRSDILDTTDGRTPIRVDVYVPSLDGTLPLRVDLLPRSSRLAPASAEGTANTYWVSLTTS